MSLKVRLLLGAAVPLALAAPALAQVQITTATTAPVSTATAGSGSTPANVEITSAGAINLPGGANSTAVTVNSNNTFTNNGAITSPNSNDSVGVRILPNLTTSYGGGGSISLLEDFTRTDTDNDGDADGPLAQGTNRVGILLESGGAMIGNIGSTGGAITIEGNNSAGISLRSNLTGNYRQRGGITITGSNSIGLDIRGDVSGDVIIGGSTLANGEGSTGVNILGNVGGEFSIDGAVSATGFTSSPATNGTNAITNYVDPDFLGPNDTPIDKRRDADDLLAGGPAVAIRGDLARGFLVNGAAVGGADPTTDVKDVIQNFNEDRTTGAVQSYGSAPAIVIQSLDGAAGNELRLGLARETVLDTTDDDGDNDRTEVIGVFNYDFGFINRGTITSSGFNIGFASNALKIAGSADGQHQTIVEGGVYNSGSITSAGFEANATSVLIGAGASTPRLVNLGSITTTVNTETDHDATAVLIEAGASLPTVTNDGLISAAVRGYDGDAVAFRDLSGTVTSFTNTSRIATGYTDDDTTDTITSGLGRAIAIDLSHATSGVTLTQTDAVDNARIFGDVLFGSGSDRFDLLSGDVTGDIDFGSAGAETLNINSARLFGDATFGGSTATVSLNSAVMGGAIALGAGGGALSFVNGSTYEGAITSGGATSIVVDNSTMNNSADTTLNLTSMSAANNAKVGFVISNARIAANAPIFNVTGTANIAGNTVFTPIFKEFTDQAFTLRVLNAGALNLGGTPEQMLNAQSPYLFVVGLTRPAGTNALDLSFRVKSEAELGLNVRQGGAFGAVLDLMEQDVTIGSALASIGTRNEFLRSYQDLLPAPDAGVMRVLASNANAAFGATAQRLDLITEKPDAPGGAWTEEFGVYHEADSAPDSLGLSGGGFGVAAGLDLLSSGTALIGAYASLESVELEERNRSSAPLNVTQTSIGAYGGWKFGNLAINAVGGAGLVQFTSDRQVSAGDLSDKLTGKWDGTSYNAGARATYTIPMGFLDVKPYVSADYMSLKQDAYQENATTVDDLELIASDNESTLSSASAGITFTGKFGSDDAYTFRPQLSVGYRNVLSWDPGETEYRFAGNSASTAFQLSPGVEPDDGIVAGLGLNVDSQFLNIRLGYDTEITDTATTHYGSVTLRMAFW